ncbi:MAG: SusC/RagA family TonB-linked outer membrane protein [Bacteroidales bacterium]|nr:SusC/RagA family TonB-linked outer membrane protein [Bacteroidales bacterium]
MIKCLKTIGILLLLTGIAVLPATAQDKAVTVTGKVLSEATQKAIPGISITVQNLTSAMTADDGSFSLSLPSADAELTITGPGYQTKKVALRGRTQLIIKLHVEDFSGSVYKEVLMPLGTVNNSHLSAAAVFLDQDKSTEVATMPEQLLQAKVSGLNTMFRSGMEGSGANLFVRGFNSLYASNQPLLVIDGMVIENAQFGSSLIEGYISTPLGAIDIQDIDRITLIKDASSVYGVKGANGALLIQTKRTTDLATKINVIAVQGLSMQPSKIPMLNADDARHYLIDMYQSSGQYSVADIQALPFVNQELPVQESWGYSGNVDYYRYNKNTDWQDEIFRPAYKQQYSLNVSGGDEVAVYGLSLGFVNKESVVEGSDFNRFNARINTGITFNPAIQVFTNMSFVYGMKNLSNEGSASYLNPMYSALVKAPFTTSFVYDEHNRRSPRYEDVDFFGHANPAVVTGLSDTENSFYRFLGNIDLNIKLSDKLKLVSNFGIDYNKERERIFYPTGGIPYESIPLAAVSNQQQHRVERLFSIFSETRLQYAHAFAYNQRLNATLGLRYLNSRAEDDYGRGYNSSSNYFISIGSGSNKLYQTGGAIGSWNWLAMYGNVDYNHKDKYFINALLSYDASSRYGAEIAAFQAFPSVGAAWLISSEEFMKNSQWIDMLKLRANYSMTGNDGIGNYTAKRYYVTQNFLGNYGLVRGNLVNEELRPERNNKLSLGLDLALLNERLNLSLDLFNSTIKDMLIHAEAPAYTGFRFYIENGGAMQNRGVDLSINARLIETEALSWDLGLAASHYRNEILSLSTGDFNTPVAGGLVRTEVGKPLGIFYGYKTEGIYQTAAEATVNQLYKMIGTVKVPYAAGDVRFVNTGDDDLIDQDDMQQIGDPNPDLHGSFWTDLAWKGISLSAVFRYSLGNDVYNYTRGNLESMSSYANQTQAVLNRWKSEVQTATLPRAVYGDPMGNAAFSDRWIEDGSYLKLKNLSLAYDIPIQTGVLRSLTVFGTAENLFCLTTYKGYDPEIISSSAEVPLYYGIDAFTTPSCQTFYLGIKIGL